MQQLSQKDAMFVAREHSVHFGKSSFIEDVDASDHSQEDGEELKQCDALFGNVQTEKSRISILSGDRDKSGLPMCGAFDEAHSSMMMFDDALIPDMNTGSSLK